MLDEDGALAVVPYRIEKSGRILIEARVNDRGPFDFAIDSGASISAVFDDFHQQLELESNSGQSATLHGVVGSGRVALLEVDKVEIGSVVWEEVTMAALPGQSDLESGIAGFLGLDFLREYSLGLSTRHRVVRLYPPNLVGRRSYRGWASIPLRLERIGTGSASLYFFEIEIEGRQLRAVFDLGAGLNIMNWPAARYLGFDPAIRDPRFSDQISGAMESAPQQSRVRAGGLTTAGILWQNEVFSVGDFEIFDTLGLGSIPTVILGSGLFTQRDFVIDFARNRLLIRTSMDELDSHAADGG